MQMSANSVAVPAEKRQTLDQYTSRAQKQNETLELLRRKLTKKQQRVKQPGVGGNAVGEAIRVVANKSVTIREPSVSSEENNKRNEPPKEVPR